MANNREPNESEILAAFRMLFPSESEIDYCGIDSMHQAQLKTAYRRKALSTHPDRFAHRGEDYQRICSERFIAVCNAYDTLSHFLTLRRQGWQWSRNHLGKSDSAATGAETTGPHRAASSSSKGSTGQQDDSAGSFWRRSVPRRYLRFAEFLYFCRVIPWKSLVSALAWQRRQRPRIGEIAQKWRWVNASQVETLLRDRRPGERVGEVLLRHGLISHFELQVLLRQQQKFQKPIGLYFVRHGVMSEGDVGRYLHHQRQHNMDFKSAFAESGFR